MKSITKNPHSLTDAAASCLNLVNDYLASRAFSRKLEMEADAVGLEVSALYIK